MGSAYRVIFRGHVQGVNLRARIAAVAREHGVTGWVRNLPDGTVEARCEGDEQAINALITSVKARPAAGQVTQVDQERLDEEPGFARFTIIR